MFFNCPIPMDGWQELADEIGFHTYLGTGGNVLGASTYFAKGILGANPIIFIGADFSFANYDVDKPMFHAWDSSYDAKMGHVMKSTDVYGNMVRSWPSYLNFKSWFDYICTVVPGIWINATEGGCLGAYPEGNLMCVKPMDLEKVLTMYSLHKETLEQCENPVDPVKKLLF